MIKFSIVTITYNAGAVFERTVRSILTQTYPAIEHIIVDGASTDNTLALAEAYRQESDKAHNGHRVRIISEPDKGLYDAMNKGLRLATGDYICFMNAGDFYPNEEVLQNIVNNTNLDDRRTLPGVLYGQTDIVDAEGRYLGPRHLTAPDNLTWKSFRQGMLVCHQAFYALTDIARTTPYNLKYRYSADVDWCIRIMKKAAAENRPLVNANMVVADYTREGETTRHHKASLQERFKVMATHYGLLTTIAMHVWFVFRRR